MRTKAMTTVLLSTLATACSWSTPCDSWYSPGECPDEGETGGEIDTSELYCHSTSEPPECIVAATAAVDPAVVQANGGEVVNHDACLSSTPPYAHVEGWHVPVTDSYSGRMDMYCGRAGYQEYGVSPELQTLLCRNDNGSQFNNQRYYPADYIAADNAYVPYFEWPLLASCTEPLDDPSMERCPRGLVALGSQGPAPWGVTVPGDPQEWTCACESDADCQDADAVCELGWTVDNGFPGPTLCTWDAGDGTLNGIAQAGPSAYGFDDWSGVVVNGRDIGVTVDFLAAAIGIEQPSGVVAFGLFNDDQAVGGRALALGHPTDAAFNEVTHAGPSSLFRHVGLQVGDLIEADEDALEVLASSGQTTVDVRHIDGTVDEFTIAMIDD